MPHVTAPLSLMLCSPMIAAKLERIANSGIDISGAHEVEFEFLVNTQKLAKDLVRHFYHPDNSMRTAIKKNRSHSGYIVKLRIDSYLTIKAISENLVWLSKKAKSNFAELESWRVVLRT